MAIGKQNFSDASSRENALGRKSTPPAKFFYIMPDDCAFSIAGDLIYTKFCHDARGGKSLEILRAARH
jgi:hypothetical protein